MTLKVERIPDELFREVKAAAVLEGMTLRQYVIDALSVALSKSASVVRKAVAK